MFWFSLQLLPETFLMLRRIERIVIVNVDRSSCKVHFILVRFFEAWIFCTDLKKKPPVSNLMKIRPVPCGMIDTQTVWRTVGQTDSRKEANSRFFAILWTRLIKDKSLKVLIFFKKKFFGALNCRMMFIDVSNVWFCAETSVCGLPHDYVPRNDWPWCVLSVMHYATMRLRNINQRNAHF